MAERQRRQGRKRTRDEMIQVGLDFVRDQGRLPTWADTDPAFELPAKGTVAKYFGGWPGYYNALEAAEAARHPAVPPKATVPRPAPRLLPDPDLDWLGGIHSLPLRKAVPELVLGDWPTPRPAPQQPPVVVIRRYHG